LGDFCLAPPEAGLGFREDFETKLKPLEVKKLSDNELQLHYQVLK